MSETDLLMQLAANGGGIGVLAFVAFKLLRNGSSHAAPCADLRVTQADIATLKESVESQRATSIDMVSTMSRMDERTENIEKKAELLALVNERSANIERILLGLKQR